LGITNSIDNCSAADKDEKEKINAVNALLGFIISKKAEICGGVMRSKVGIGFGYSLFQLIYVPYNTLKVYLNAYNFRRNKRGPEIGTDIRFRITEWLYAGVAVEDISHKISVVPYIRFKVRDKSLTMLLGIIGITAIVLR
jgi:hypothetical protein